MLLFSSSLSRDINKECYQRPNVFCVGTKDNHSVFPSESEEQSCFHYRNCQLIASVKLITIENKDELEWTLLTESINKSYNLSVIISKQVIHNLDSTPTESVVLLVTKHLEEGVIVNIIFIDAKGSEIEDHRDYESRVNTSLNPKEIKSNESGFDIFVLSSPNIIISPDKKQSIDFMKTPISISIFLMNENVNNNGTNRSEIKGMKPAKLFDSNTVFEFVWRLKKESTFSFGQWTLIFMSVLFSIVAIILMITMTRRYKTRRLRKDSKSSESKKSWRPTQETGTVGLFLLNQKRKQQQR